MGLFSNLIGSAINSAINYNDKDHFFRILCLVIYADSGDASSDDIFIATELYNTIFFNEKKYEEQIHEKLKSTYHDICNSNKSPEEIIEDIESGRIDRNKLKIFFICACYISSISDLSNISNIDDYVSNLHIKLIKNKKKLYIVYLIKEVFNLTENEINDAYMFAENNFYFRDEINYFNFRDYIWEALLNFENNLFEEIEEALKNKKMETNELNYDNHSNYMNIDFNLGNSYFQNGQYKEAIDSFLKAIESNPNDSNTWLALSLSYGEDEQYKKAIEALLKAKELNPNNPAIAIDSLPALYSRQAAYFFENKQYKEAIDSLLKAIEITPEHSLVWEMLGFSYYHDGQYKEAIDSLLKSIELNPTVDAWITLCKIYRKNGNIKELKHAIAKAKELNPNLDYGKLIMKE